MASTPEKVPVRMKREINLLYACSIMVGTVIGSGIFVSPVSIIRHTGSPGVALIVWLVSGLLATGLALSYAELASIFPKAGGDYAYYKGTFGSSLAFMLVWVHYTTVKPTFWAILSLTTATYTFQPFYPDCEVPTVLVKLFSIWIIQEVCLYIRLNGRSLTLTAAVIMKHTIQIPVTVTVLNSVYVRHVTRVQFIFTAVKLLALLLVVGIGIHYIASDHENYLTRPFEGTRRSPGGVAVAVVSGCFTYGGWNYLFYLVEEVKNPAKVVPRTCIISMTTVIALYILTNVAYFSVLSPALMVTSPAVAVTFVQRTVPALTPLIAACVACSTAGALTGAMLGGSRKYFAAARDGLFPGVMAGIQRHYMTPWPALWSGCALAIIYITLGDAVQLIEYLGFVDIVTYLVSMVCLLYLRHKRPDVTRTVKLPLVVPVTCLVVMVIAGGLALYQQPLENGIGVIIMLTSLPAYLIGVKWMSRPTVLLSTRVKITTTIQKLLMVVEQDEEEIENHSE